MIDRTSKDRLAPPNSGPATAPTSETSTELSPLASASFGTSLEAGPRTLTGFDVAKRHSSTRIGETSIEFVFTTAA